MSPRFCKPCVKPAEPDVIERIAAQAGRSAAREDVGDILDEVLVEAGVDRQLLDAEIDHRAWHRVAEVLRQIGRALVDYNSHSAAVAGALGLAEPFGPMAQIAAQLGVSRQAASKTLHELDEVFAPVLRRAPPVVQRPPRRGNWLTRPEVRQQLGVGLKQLAALRVRPVRHQGRDFYDGAAVRAARDAAIVAAAKGGRR
jgi:DNA-binding phage protein